MGYTAKTCIRAALVLLLGCSLILSGCGKQQPAENPPAEEPKTEEAVWNNTRLADRVLAVAAEPDIRLFRSAAGRVDVLPLEDYIAGVVAAEIGPDFPFEALKAQAIVARSMTLALMKLEGAMESKHASDASDDHTEFQAYSAEDITEDIRRAVEQTRGIILTFEGDFAYTLFHSVSDGLTASIAEAMPGLAEAAPYLVPVETAGNTAAPEKYRRWTLKLSASEVASAMGTAPPLTALSVSETGPSGRALTLTAGPGEVQKPAVEFRQAIGFDRLYSTILRDIRLEGDSVILEGAGWGHGAGMEQWGAYVMAEDGADAFAILAHYYPRLQLTQLYD